MPAEYRFCIIGDPDTGLWLAQDMPREPWGDAEPIRWVSSSSEANRFEPRHAEALLPLLRRRWPHVDIYKIP